MYSPASPRLAHCRGLLELLTLILSLCERERRAALEERKDPRVNALVRLAPIAGERTEVRGLILLFEDSVGS